MATTYTRTLSGDFKNTSQLDVAAFTAVIDADATVSVNVKTLFLDGDDVKIKFPQALTAEQEAQLDILVAAYTYSAPISSTSGVYEAIVALDGSGDYTSIPAAFNSGAKSVFVKNGTYVTTSDIVIPNSGQMVGESNADVIIYFIGAYGVKCDGNNGVKETTGTFSIDVDTDQVVGTGTSFTNAAPGQYIMLGTNYFVVASIESDTALTVSPTYRGASMSGCITKILPMYLGCKIAGLIITGSYTTGLFIRGVRHGSLKSVTVASCAQNITVEDISDFSCVEIVSTLSASTGVVIKGCTSLSCSVFNIFGCGSHGIEMDGISCNIVIESTAIENNGGAGYNIIGSNTQHTLTDNIIRFNNGGGVITNSTSSLVSFSSCTVSNNNGYGFNIGGDCGIVSGCAVSKNTGIGIKVGVRTIVESCHVIGNLGDGIKAPLNCDKSVINGNNVINNGGIGVNIVADRTIIEGNLYDNNTGNNLHISGNKNNVQGSSVLNSGAKGAMITGNYNIFSDCIVDGNTGDGIYVTGNNNCITLNESLNNGGIGIYNSGTENDFCHDCAEDNTGTQYVDIGTGTILIKHHIEASDPSATDDKSIGYGISSTWVNTATKRSFRSVDATVGGAVWETDPVYGNENTYAESDVESSTAMTTFQTKVTFTTGSLAGSYEMKYCAEAYGDVEARVVVDGTTVATHTMNDAYWASLSGFKRIAFGAAATVTISYKAVSGTAKIRNARLNMIRVG